LRFTQGSVVRFIFNQRVGKASLLETHQVVERAVKPLIIFVGIEVRQVADERLSITPGRTLAQIFGAGRAGIALAAA
jgi:hypothetical protein